MKWLGKLICWLLYQFSPAAKPPPANTIHTDEHPYYQPGGWSCRCNLPPAIGEMIVDKRAEESINKPSTKKTRKDYVYNYGKPFEEKLRHGDSKLIQQATGKSASAVAQVKAGTMMSKEIRDLIFLSKNNRPEFLETCARLIREREGAGV